MSCQRFPGGFRFVAVVRGEERGLAGNCHKTCSIDAEKIAPERKCNARKMQNASSGSICENLEFNLDPKQ